MMDLTFTGLFKTTLKGIANTNNLPTQISLSKTFFIYSAIFQFIIFLILLLYLALSMFRILKKIKNGKFRDVPDPYQRERKKEKHQQGRDKSIKQGKRAYEFDEDYEVEEERGNKVMDTNGRRRNKKEDFDSYHHEKEESFIKLDGQLLFFTPFLIPFIIVNNIFAVDILSLGLFILTTASYLIFNIKGKLSQVKPLQFIFIACSLFGYFSYFYNDHDLTT